MFFSHLKMSLGKGSSLLPENKKDKVILGLYLPNV